MSHMGHERRSSNVRVPAASPSAPEIRDALRHFGLVPSPDVVVDPPPELWDTFKGGFRLRVLPQPGHTMV